jgi:glycosyltransferase involved in cell wall biosynthesis
MLYINGRFLSRSVTGVERFASELLRRLNDAVPRPDQVTVLVPPGTPRPEWLDRLAFREVGRGGGHMWEQTSLYLASRGGTLLNLCNSGPVAHGDSLVVVHDAWVFRHPDHFSLPYRLFHQGLDRLLVRRARIATVSRFSQSELSSILHVPADRIAIVRNAADHLDRIVPDEAVLRALDLEGRRYLLLVGSFAPNKNMPRAIRAFIEVARPEERLVVVGAQVGVFANDDLSNLPPNILLPGRVPDETLAALYQGATALLFPSLYEGFGIPPLEAMHYGTPVLASDIAVVQEICGDAALYYDALDEAAIGRSIRRVLDEPAEHKRLSLAALARRQQFSWAASLKDLLTLIDIN